ncbi:DUF1707 domain-containing protein [Actinoplanes sp. NPDC051851]|uniref:DUF1707 SHOCT-like domain-containing protein n=1 Tax=Actinoplanes sp. NPDC051851 TaxID=3154753 RepID=UPI00342DC689
MDDDGVRMRSSDSEREKVAEVVRVAMGEGRLTLDEGEERLVRTYASRYRDELTALTRDLPAQSPRPPATRRSMSPSPQRPATRRSMSPSPRRPATRRSMSRHTVRVMIAGGVLTALWAASGAHFFWPAIPLTFLVAGLIRHARYGRYEFRPHAVPR